MKEMNGINDLFNKARQEAENADFDEKTKPCGSQRIPRIPYISPKEFIPAISKRVSRHFMLYFAFAIVAILLCVSSFFLGQNTTSNEAESVLEKQEEKVYVQEEQFDFEEFLNKKMEERYGASFLPPKSELEQLNHHITESQNKGTTSTVDGRTSDTNNKKINPAQQGNNTIPSNLSENADSSYSFSKTEQEEEYYLTPAEKSLIDARNRLFEQLQEVNVDF